MIKVIGITNSIKMISECIIRAKINSKKLQGELPPKLKHVKRSCCIRLPIVLIKYNK